MFGFLKAGEFALETHQVEIAFRIFIIENWKYGIFGVTNFNKSEIQFTANHGICMNELFSGKLQLNTKLCEPQNLKSDHSSARHDHFWSFQIYSHFKVSNNIRLVSFISFIQHTFCCFTLFGFPSKNSWNFLTFFLSFFLLAKMIASTQLKNTDTTV